MGVAWRGCACCRWVGHGGFGGQWMAAAPAEGTSLAFFSVFDDSGGVGELVPMTNAVLNLVAAAAV